MMGTKREDGRYPFAHKWLTLLPFSCQTVRADGTPILQLAFRMMTDFFLIKYKLPLRLLPYPGKVRALEGYQL